MKKILIMVNGLYGGGAEKVLQTLLNNLDYEKYNITLISLKKEYINPDIFKMKFKYSYIYNQIEEEMNFVKAFFLKLSNKVKLILYDLLPPNLFYPLIIKKKYDTEIAFIEGESTKIISGSRNKKSKKIAWVHTDLSKNHWTEVCYKSFEQEKKSYQAFDRIVCVSQDVADSVKKVFEIEKLIEVKYNPIDSKEIIIKSKEKIEIIPDKKPLLISIGRLEKQKGYDRLIEAALLLKKLDYKFEIWIIGEGSESKSLESCVTSHNLKDCFKFLGYKKNPYKYLAMADIFIVSSLAEGFSTVVNEALCLKKPIIATNCAGIKEQIGSSGCGLVVENSVDGIVDGIKIFLEDEKLILKYKKQCERKICEFDLEKAIKSIEELF